jgi:Raf kinase inhibitor-like YbhB/YbcL family protein
LPPAPEPLPVESADVPAVPQNAPLKWIFAIVLGVSALAVGLFALLRRRAERAPEPVVTPATPAASDPELAEGARPTKRPSCAAHGLATGPDGLCVLCRSEQKRASLKAPAAPGVPSIRVAALATAAIALLTLGIGWAVYRTPSKPEVTSNPATASSIAAVASGSARVSDSNRTQAREPGIAYPGAPDMIQSPKFRSGSGIPVEYTCDGKNLSPPLTFSNVPMNAKSLALKMVARRATEEVLRGSKRGRPKAEDPAAHWTLYNLPPDLAGLPEGATELPPGASAERGRDGSIYSGPCPTGGKMSYEFWLYALDVRLPELGAGERLDIPTKHAVGITIENGSYSYWRSARLIIPDLPPELRDKQAHYEVCDSRGRNCDTSPVSTPDSGLLLQLPYRNGLTHFWFAEPGDGGRELTPHFAFDLNSPDCRKKTPDSVPDCTLGYGFLKP